MKRDYATVELRDFIIENVEEYPNSVTHLVSEKFGISRQAVNRYIHKLVYDGVLVEKGHTRGKSYSLKTIKEDEFVLNITPGFEEDVIWRRKVKPLLSGIKSNVVDICHYGFTEMLNNVIEHAESKSVMVVFKHIPNKIELVVMDTGIGIFNKITRELGLEDNRHAVLELSKGKLTTDQENHTGEGIFFTSRMFDKYTIISGELYFSHTQGEEEDWLLEDREQKVEGTMVEMSIATNSNRRTLDVFDKYAATDDDYTFTRTHVPVALAQYGGDNLISRSQAKRLLARLEPFKEVFLNFEGVDFIGQPFADEIFRVFKKNNPNIDILVTYANEKIEKMIKRVTSESIAEK